jgi:hypothetical protein
MNQGRKIILLLTSHSLALILPTCRINWVPNNVSRWQMGFNLAFKRLFCIAIGYVLDGQGIESRWREIFSAPVQIGPTVHPASSPTGTGSLLGVNSGRGVTLNRHPILVPWSWKGKAIPLLLLWAVLPVQSLSACTRMYFTLPFVYVYVPCRRTVHDNKHPG